MIKSHTVDEYSYNMKFSNTPESLTPKLPYDDNYKT